MNCSKPKVKSGPLSRPTSASSIFGDARTPSCSRSFGRCASGSIVSGERLGSAQMLAVRDCRGRGPAASTTVLSGKEGEDARRRNGRR